MHIFIPEKHNTYVELSLQKHLMVEDLSAELKV